MPSVIVRIDQGMAGNDVATRVDAQVANLQAIVSGIQQLATNPPTKVANLRRAFGDVRLPDFPAPASFANVLTRIATAVPSDTAGLSGALLADIARIEAEFSGALAGALTNALSAFERLRALADLDLRCPPPGSEPPAAPPGGGADGEEGAEGGGGEGQAGGDRSETKAAASRARAALDALPSPLDVRAFLTWLHGTTSFNRRDARIPAVIPVFDDVRDPLDTLVQWDAMGASEVLAHAGQSLDEAAAFLDSVTDGAIDPLLAELDAFGTSLSPGDLQRIADGLATALTQLGQAVNGGSAAGMNAAATAVTTLLDEYDPLRAGIATTLVDLPRLQLRVTELGEDLDQALASAISLLRPGGTALTRLPQPSGAEVLGEIEVWLTGIVDWLQDVLLALDLAALEAPLAEVTESVRAAGQGLDAGVVTLTASVQAVLQQVEDAIAEVDAGAASAEVQAVLEEFRDAVVSRIQQLVEPASAAITSAVNALDGAVDAFDPQQIVAALTDAVNALAGVLGTGEVADAIAQVRAALEAVTQQIGALTFAPVTDQVIAAIEEITKALSSIDVAQLPAPAVGALEASVSILPQDLAPITDPVVVDFGGLVESGPVQLLEQVRAQPAKLLDAVRRFEPAKLLGDSLSTPFQSVLRDMEAFRPGRLFDPLDAELDGLKERLLRAGGPGTALEPLAAGFQQVLTHIDALAPGALIEPLDAAISEALERLLDVLPVDETFAVVDAALGAVQDALAVSDEIAALLARAAEVLAAFADARAQLEAWVDEVLDKVSGIGSTTSLQAPLGRLHEAVEQTRGPVLLARVTNGTAALRSTLSDARASERLGAVVQAHRGVSRAALQALPDSPAKSAATAVLDRLDPLSASFSAPFRAVHELAQALAGSLGELAARVATWDQRFHSPGGALASLQRTEMTAAELRAFIEPVLRAQLVEPLAAVFGLLEPFRSTLAVLAGQLETLLAAVRARLDALLLGPDSLAGLRTELGQLTESVLAVDLDFLQESLDAVHARVKAQLAALDPAVLQATLNAAWAAVLDTVSLDLLLPPAVRAQLDETYREVLEKLRALDPGTVVVATVQPLFDETVLPLLEAFDLTLLFDAIIDKLRGTEAELRAELGRVNGSYQAMLAAVPSTNGAVSAGVSL